MSTRYNFIDISGQRFNLLTAIRHIGNSIWVFRCKCGNEILRRGSEVRYGKRKSCGCSTQALIDASGRQVHGLSKTPEYKIWCGMKARCYNKNKKNYQRYGGRGIDVCQKWRDDFHEFFTDMGPRPSPKHTIERKDNLLGYYPSNCEWVLPIVQNRNRRNTRRITVNGETKTFEEWSIKTGISENTLRARFYERGFTGEQTVLTPIGKHANKRQ